MLQLPGSGKTAVLVERMIQKIINEKVDIDKILIVTFTNAAASEMKERILDAIYKKIEENPEDVHMQRQITLLNKASISTIHSFCLEVIKNNFFEIDISPNFRIGESSEIELLKLESLEELFENKYNEENKEFLKLIETYTNYRGDEPLKELILKIYKFIQSSPFPDEWLEEKIEYFNVKEEIDFSETIWGKILLENLKDVVKETINGLQNVLKELEKNYELEKFIKCIKLDIENLIELEKNINTWDNTYEHINKFNFNKWPIDRKIVSNIKEEAKAKRDIINKKIKAEKENIFIYNSKEANEDLKDLYDILKILKNIILEFSELYNKKKKEKNIIDFNDIEHFALKILVKKDEDGNYVATEIANKYKEKYNEIAIDEYQDSNLVQEYILSQISNGKNIFMVGDVKQSIYKFRQARPELFLEKYNTYKLKEDLEENNNLKIQLFKNFRSRENILNITNFIFNEIMSKELGDIDYNKEEFLNLGAEYPKLESNLNIETDIINLKEDNESEEDEYIEDEENNNEPIEKNIIEAKFVANKINELISSKFQVYDRKVGFRDIQYKDIVILLRATSNVAPIYEKEISELNIPVYSDSSAEYLESIEIQTIMNVLKIINNPMQDIPLVSVLRSMIGDFSDNQIVEIRLVDKHCCFYETLQKSLLQVNDELREKIENFLKKLQEWREENEFLSLHELIWKIYEDTCYYEYVGLMKNGALRQANLKMLFEKAKVYEEASFTGLLNFINFIEKLKLSSGDMGTAKIIGENENVVRIMSIHKSKGLEFPIVFLCNSSKQFNMKDLNNNILLDQDIGLGPKYIDYVKKIEYNTLAKEAIKIKSKREIISEEMRVLYVALTRAKEKLIITGTSKDIEKDMQEKRKLLEMYKSEKINKSIVGNYISYLDWIELVYIKNEEKIKEFFDLNIINKSDILNIKSNENNRENVTLNLKNKLKNARKVPEELMKKIEWNYSNIELTKIMSKMSVSEIKKEKNIENHILEETTLNTPKFIREEKVTNARKGTLVHLCLQYLDPRKEYTINNIKDILFNLKNKNIITSIEAESVNYNKVLNFTKSKIWEELKKAKSIEKEKPFYINIPAKEIYNNEIEEKILVQGVIDLYYINQNNELILVDYKTDYVEGRKEETLIEKYKTQLELYKQALEQALERKVEKVYIYSTYLDKEILCNI